MRLGAEAENYIKVLGKPKNYKRSKVGFKVSGSSVEISVVAEDVTALLASLGSAIKQLGVVASVSRIARAGSAAKHG
ncbi:MAG: KEOPS complex subunit Pcc1 [Candidatus Micrarchaeia archaeon]